MPEGEGAETSSAGDFSMPLWAVLACSLLISVALGFGLRALGRMWLNVPTGLPSLAISSLLPAAVLPVLGNCFGFYMAFRAKPSDHSMRLFIAIGAVMSVIGVAITASKLPTSPGAGSVVTTVAVSLLPSILVIAALLRLVPRQPPGR